MAEHVATARTAVRSELAAAIAAELGDTWLVIPAPKEIDNLDAGYTAGILVYRTDIAPSAQAGAQMHTLTVWVFVPQTNPDGPAEDALDAAADALIEVLEPMLWLTWTAASRANYLDRYPGYSFTLTVPTTITQE